MSAVSLVALVTNFLAKFPVRDTYADDFIRAFRGEIIGAMMEARQEELAEAHVYLLKSSHYHAMLEDLVRWALTGVVDEYLGIDWELADLALLQRLMPQSLDLSIHDAIAHSAPRFTVERWVITCPLESNPVSFEPMFDFRVLEVDEPAVFIRMVDAGWIGSVETLRVGADGGTDVPGLTEAVNRLPRVETLSLYWDEVPVGEGHVSADVCTINVSRLTATAPAVFARSPDGNPIIPE